MAQPPDRDVSEALAYHERTKHHLDRYARSPGHLDWAKQPNPFRTYAGAVKVELPLLADAIPTGYDDLYHPGAVPARKADLNTVAVLFELALGLSAWKEYRGSRWALRCNPSSGNLHPTEGYAVVPELPLLPAGVYHYDSHDHALEQRCRLTESAAAALARQLPPGGFLVGLTSIPWREAWKYGERAFRYCQHDLGHAVATVRYAAAALGWSAVLLEAFADADRCRLFGLDRAEDSSHLHEGEREQPGPLLLISPRLVRPGDVALIPEEVVAGGTWSGRPNVLSSGHVSWDVIADVSAATRKPATALLPQAGLPDVPPLARRRSVPAATLIRQRRSCLGLDGRTAISAATFYDILDRLLPRPGVAPWDALSWGPSLHLGIFVHRVQDLSPGLYLFERAPAEHEALRAALRPNFLWRRPAGCPDHLPLYGLHEADLRETAQTVSCHQEIAADGAFSLGMVADFGDRIRQRGAWWYRRLFWEAGVLGQVLYLEAEAAGVRGTGIGCYFDDAFHRVLGLTGDRWQDLYHFTIGGPVEDRRLSTLPPYAHLRRNEIGR